MVGKEEPLSKGKGNEMLLLRAEGTLTGKGGLHVWAEKQMKTKCKNVITLHDNLKI